MKARQNYVFQNCEKRVIGYARVSTAMQTEGTSLQSQEQRLKDAGAEFVITDVISGQKKKRPGLSQIMAMVKNKEVDEVIVCALDRLGRNVRLIHRNVDLLIASKVNLKALNQDFDLSTPQGKFLLTMLGALAELEVAQTSERICNNNEVARQNKSACSSVPFGYVRVEYKQPQENIDQSIHEPKTVQATREAQPSKASARKQRLYRYCLDQHPFLCLLEDKPEQLCDEVTGEEVIILGTSRAEVARDCIELFLKVRGLSKALKLIFEKYGVNGRFRGHRSGAKAPLYWTAPGFRRWLQNPVHVGDTAYLKRKQISYDVRKVLPRSQWSVVKNTHPDDCLVSREEAAEITRIIQFNSKRVGAHQHSDGKDGNALKPFVYLQSLVFCEACGAKAITKTRQSKDGKTKYRYFACRHARKGCNNYKGTPKQLIEDRLIQHLVERSQSLQSESPVIDGEPPSSPKLSELHASLEVFKLLPDSNPQKSQLIQKTQKSIQEELDPFSTRAYERKSVRELLAAGNSLAVWNTLATDVKADVFSRLLREVKIRDGKVTSIQLND